METRSYPKLVTLKTQKLSFGRFFLRQPLRRQLAQLVVDQWQKLLRRVRIAFET
jgi:hypothetical protein